MPTMPSARRRWRLRPPRRGCRTHVRDVASRQERGAAAPAERRGQPDRGDAGAAFDRSRRSRRAASSAARLATFPPVSAETVRAVIRARRLRARYFPEELFADPAWDMLLDLLQAEIAQLRVPVSSLCIAAAVPATTALRWLKTMVQRGHLRPPRRSA